MQHLFLVMLGGALGSGARFGVGRLTLAHFGPGYPWGTLAVNLIGGLLMGFLVGLLARIAQPEQSYFLFIGTGILGGFTTFSAFSLDAVTMIQRGAISAAALYALVSVIGSIATLFAGLAAARGFA
ncbi:fluoride efflux transporter CrcB [Sphingobium boeckii]|uniref:Fluoride-specific ion channel FluC n=1 Tax=Sphingobium boeckii TaxID=1082345 RepID=A0A7W9AF82_9SPHN|nr:fluoride efflux transporter CrcB [Sphingobium boeckii]MBB5684369.1 CrcB protein [Sphingobium boeckii]